MVATLVAERQALPYVELHLNQLDIQAVDGKLERSSLYLNTTWPSTEPIQATTDISTESSEKSLTLSTTWLERGK